MPILDKPSASGQSIAWRAESFLFVPVAGTNKKLTYLFLCDLRVSVVKPITGFTKYP
jgi:hypothetical protein